MAGVNANLASAVDGGMPLQPNSRPRCPAATDSQRSCAMSYRYLLTLLTVAVVALGFVERGRVFITVYLGLRLSGSWPMCRQSSK